MKKIYAILLGLYYLLLTSVGTTKPNTTCQPSILQYLSEFPDLEKHCLILSYQFFFLYGFSQDAESFYFRRFSPEWQRSRKELQAWLSRPELWNLSHDQLTQCQKEKPDLIVFNHFDLAESNTTNLKAVKISDACIRTDARFHEEFLISKIEHQIQVASLTNTEILSRDYYLRVATTKLKKVAQRNPSRLRRGKLANRDITSMPFEDSPRLAAGSFNQTLVLLIERNIAGGNTPWTEFQSYELQPASGKIIPYPLFETAQGLSHHLSSQYISFDKQKGDLEPHPIQNQKMASQFTIHSYCDQTCKAQNPKAEYQNVIFRWNKDHFVEARIDHKRAQYQQCEEAFRKTILEKNDFSEQNPPSICNAFYAASYPYPCHWLLALTERALQQKQFDEAWDLSLDSLEACGTTSSTKLEKAFEQYLAALVHQPGYFIESWGAEASQGML